LNIFILDRNPKIAATMLCDKHVVKMIIETAQILCTVARFRGYMGAPYKSTHKNHPCTKWTAESGANWDWLVEHGLEMCTEYTKRYGKTHKTQEVIEWCKNIPTKPEGNKMTPFKVVMPDKYKCNDPVKSYRDYYIGEKQKFAKWKLEKPAWWI